jgi:hypothetical protein
VFDIDQGPAAELDHLQFLRIGAYRGVIDTAIAPISLPMRLINLDEAAAQSAVHCAAPLAGAVGDHEETELKHRLAVARSVEEQSGREAA